MKGSKLKILILSAIAITSAIIMVSLNSYPSWSQYARSLQEPLLLLALSAISSLFLLRSNGFKDGNYILFKFLGVDFRVKQMNTLTGFFFIGVLCTPVTHPNIIISSLHYVFTGFAIVTACLEVVFYNKKAWSYIIIALGLIGFGLAFILRLYSVGMGEIIVALPILFNVWYHKNKLEE